MLSTPVRETTYWVKNRASIAGVIVATACMVVPGSPIAWALSLVAGSKPEPGTAAVAIFSSSVMRTDSFNNPCGN